MRLRPNPFARERAKKGDVLAVARLAAISGTKWTAHLIPLCHTIPIESVEVRFQWQTEPGAEIQRLACQVTCQTTGKTGIEMEAMTGASVAGLTVYDMLNSVDRAMQIGPTRLLEKSGGKSGDFQVSEFQPDQHKPDQPKLGEPMPGEPRPGEPRPGEPRPGDVAFPGDSGPA